MWVSCSFSRNTQKPNPGAHTQQEPRHGVLEHPIPGVGDCDFGVLAHSGCSSPGPVGKRKASSTPGTRRGIPGVRGSSLRLNSAYKSRNTAKVRGAGKGRNGDRRRSRSRESRRPASARGRPRRCWAVRPSPARGKPRLPARMGPWERTSAWTRPQLTPYFLPLPETASLSLFPASEFMVALPEGRG